MQGNDLFMTLVGAVFKHIPLPEYYRALYYHWGCYGNSACGSDLYYLLLKVTVCGCSMCLCKFVCVCVCMLV